MTTLPAAGLVLLLSACGSTFSNDLFLDDADFAAALPSDQHLALSYPAPAEGVVEDPADLYAITVQTLSVGGAVLALATDATAQVLALPPSERGEDYRVWGPFPYEDNPDWFLRVELSRSSTGALYTYAFQVAETSAGPWAELLEGRHEVGEEQVALGEGAVWWRDPTGQGEVAITYDLRDTPTIGAVVTALDLGGGAIDQQWTWTEEADGGGRLSHSQPADAVPALHGAGDEALTVESRWLSDGTGRGDAWLSGGDLYAATVQLRQCWSSSGEATWSWDSEGWTEELGDSGACGL
ncbi:hypothetical protein L6R53_03905 [Myxococcota bacterium]|nr:hypothetical protein [Myxococcota bacterium]